MEEFLVYDGSYEGFLLACFQALRRGYGSVAIMPQGQDQLVMGRFVLVNVSEGDAKHMINWVERCMGEKAVKVSELAFRSDAEGREDSLLSFFRVGIKKGKSWDCPPWPPEVEAVVRMARFTLREFHRWRGITRFRWVADDGLLLAEVEPNADILDLLAGHFRRRMPDTAWEIHDVRRGRKICHLASPTRSSPPKGRLNSPEKPPVEISVLWNRYFDAVSLPERQNPQLQRSHLPLRYWRFVPEYRRLVRDEDSDAGADDQ